MCALMPSVDHPGRPARLQLPGENTQAQGAVTGDEGPRRVSLFCFCFKLVVLLKKLFIYVWLYWVFVAVQAVLWL